MSNNYFYEKSQFGGDPTSSFQSHQQTRPTGARNAEKWGSYSLKRHSVVIFTALHGMQTRSSDENSVCPSVRLSVCPSVTRMDCDKTVERSVQIYIPYERTFSLVF